MAKIVGADCSMSGFGFNTFISHAPRKKIALFPFLHKTQEYKIVSPYSTRTVKTKSCYLNYNKDSIAYSEDNGKSYNVLFGKFKLLKKNKSGKLEAIARNTGKIDYISGWADGLS